VVNRREKVAHSIAQFAQHDSVLGSALEIFDAESILQASSEHGSLADITLLVKDNICQNGRIASCASKMLEHYRSSYDATVIDRLKNAGALLVGRANCDEFAIGSSTETSAYQMTLNPWDTSRVAGGSSGGSAAAVAAGLVDCALGTETGNSIRQPASLCGIIGMRPTYGRVSRYGLIAYGSSLDQIGVFSRNVHDNARVMSVIAGHDAHDATSSKHPREVYEKACSGAIKSGLRIGVIDNALNTAGMDPEVTTCLQEALQEYKKLGAEIIHLTLPTMEDSAAVYIMISRAEVASNLARFDGIRYGSRDDNARDLVEVYRNTRSHLFGKEVKRRIMIGNYVLSAGYADQYYKKACAVRAGMREEFFAALKTVDVLFAPVSPIPAFKLHAFDQDRLQMDLQDYFSAPATLTGIPAIAIPCGFTQSGLPIGFQLMGPLFSEALLYQTGYAYESVTSWHTYTPTSYKK